MIKRTGRRKVSLHCRDEFVMHLTGTSRVVFWLLSVVASAQEPDSLPQNISAHSNRALIDSVYQTVLGYYPLELMDSMSWTGDYRNVIKPDPGLVQIPKAPRNAFELVRALGDTAANLFTFREVATLNGTEAAIIDTVIAYHFTKDYGYLRITGFHRSDSLMSKLERALEELGGIDGLALDISGTGSEEVALQAAGYLTRDPYKAYIVRKRIPFSAKTQADTVWVRPRGNRQYAGPIVVATEHNWTSEAASCFAQAMRSRKDTKFTRGGDHKGSYFRGMRTQTVAMPDSHILKLPTATLIDNTGGLISGKKRWQPTIVMSTCILWVAYISKKDMTGPGFLHVNECWLTLNSMTGRSSHRWK